MQKRATFFFPQTSLIVRVFFLSFLLLRFTLRTYISFLFFFFFFLLCAFLQMIADIYVCSGGLDIVVCFTSPEGAGTFLLCTLHGKRGPKRASSITAKGFRDPRETQVRRLAPDVAAVFVQPRNKIEGFPWWRANGGVGGGPAVTVSAVFLGHGFFFLSCFLFSNRQLLHHARLLTMVRNAYTNRLVPRFNMKRPSYIPPSLPSSPSPPPHRYSGGTLHIWLFDVGPGRGRWQGGIRTEYGIYCHLKQRGLFV